MYEIFLDKYADIVERLQDQESIDIFKIRIDYLMHKDSDRLAKELFNVSKYRKFVLPELEDALKRKGNQKIILFGCGKDAMINKEVLDYCGYNVYAFCDNYYTEKKFLGTEVIPVVEAAKDSDSLIIISSRRYKYEMYEQLIMLGVDITRILMLVKYGGVITGFDINNQYFDVFKKGDEEIFLDVGGYDGITTKLFKEWTGNFDSEAYIIEASELNINNIRERIERYKLKNVKIIEGAAWNEECTLNFDDKGAASEISSNGDEIRAIKIDNAIEAATFIKMDVEGAEYQALQGAEKLIKKYKPRMAISIYHKDWDILTIATEILRINNNYKFKIRHYSTNIWETVLYAYIN